MVVYDYDEFMLRLVFLLILTPTALGYLIKRLLRPDFPGFAPFYFVLGFLAMVAQFALICYPATWKDYPFHKVVIAVCVLYGIECLLALVLYVLRLRAGQADSGSAGAEHSLTARAKSGLAAWIRSPWFWVIIVFCGVQLARLVFGMPYEPRDSKTYNAIMNDILQTDHLFRVIPKTGRLVATPLDITLKFIMSPWYAFEAALAKAGGMHPLIIANTVMPAYVVILYYVIIYHLGMFLFKRERSGACMMTAIVAILNELTINLSVQSQILLLWPEWGKGVLSRLVLPALLLLYAFYVSDEYKTSFGGLVCAGLVCSVAGCAMSTMAAIIIPMELGLLGLIWAIRRRSWGPILMSFLVCVPVFIYNVCYFLLSR